MAEPDNTSPVDPPDLPSSAQTPADPTPPRQEVKTASRDLSAAQVVFWSIGSVLLVIAVVAGGIYYALGLSTAREVAKENQEVTVRLTNAVSGRICVCIDYDRSSRMAVRAMAERSAEASAPSAEACLIPLVPVPEPGILGQAWAFIANFLPNAKSSEQTPWQLAQPTINRINVPADANFYGSIAALNYAIADERLQSIRSAEESGRKASVFQILIIAIGALTTMAVSLRTMDSLIGESAMRGLSIAAILLSALGTGAASLNSFYAPREASVRQVRGLVQLKQLHQELYVYLSAERCDITPMARVDSQSADLTDPRARRVRLWHSQLQQIVGGADAPVPEASDNARLITQPSPKTRPTDQERAVSRGAQPPPAIQ